jgi:hypothetical protein
MCETPALPMRGVEPLHQPLDRAGIGEPRPDHRDLQHDDRVERRTAVPGPGGVDQSRIQPGPERLELHRLR